MGVYDHEPFSCNGLVMRIYPNWLRNSKWSFIHLIQVLNTFTKQQGCKDPCKIKMSQFWKI